MFIDLKFYTYHSHFFTHVRQKKHPYGNKAKAPSKQNIFHFYRIEKIYINISTTKW